MKLSVSLPEDDVAVLDRFIEASGLSSRSAGLRHAIAMLRHPDLETDYEAAWSEWEASGERAAWDIVALDGLDDASR